MLRRLRDAVIGLLLAAAIPAAAAERGESVNAAQPAGMVIALMNAGYDAELGRDSRGAPMIRVATQAYPLTIAFYGCDEQTQRNCDSVQLITGLDRAQPWTAESAVALMRAYRFIAVNLDEEGDPILTWDIYTGSGIPAAVFLETVSRFEGVVNLAAESVFGK
jgi:hypothetical protein